MSIVEKFISMEYGPALEDPREALVWLDHHERSASCTSSMARGMSPAEGEYFDTTDPSTGRSPGGCLAGFAAGCGCGGESRTGGAAGVAGALCRHVRARYLYALARQIQKHSRRLAVLETMDNGKPIRESRDIDIPLGRASFLPSRRLGATPAARVSGLHRLRSRGSNHPLEFSALDAGVEDRTSAGHGEYRRSEACGIHAADRPGFRRHLPRSRFTRWGCEYCDRRWLDR